MRTNNKVSNSCLACLARDEDDRQQQKNIARKSASLSATATHLGFVGKVSPAGLPLAVGTSHLFDRDDAGEGPQVGVRDPRVLLLDRLEEPARVFEAGAAGGK